MRAWVRRQFAQICGRRGVYGNTAPEPVSVFSNPSGTRRLLGPRNDDLRTWRDRLFARSVELDVSVRPRTIYPI